MLLNEEHRWPVLVKTLYYQKGYGARKLMKEFPAKTWRKVTLNFLNRLKETGNRAKQHNTALNVFFTYGQCQYGRVFHG